MAVYFFSFFENIFFAFRLCVYSIFSNKKINYFFLFFKLINIFKIFFY